jgi:cytochrome c551/c552
MRALSRNFVAGMGLVVLPGGLLTILLAQSGPSAKTPQTILQAQCVSCHGQVLMSDLDLRDRQALLKGGKRGPAIVPGNADGSLLYQAVKREGDLQMPPGKSGLPPEDVAILRDWIDAGASWDTAAPAAAAAPSWWSFKKVSRPPVPEVKNAAWVRSPIDKFILAKLEEKGLQPAKETGRRTLVRRAYFDLHGLPPTPEQVDEFVHDQSPDAYEKLIDRLLASPRYGERWGRYWLDLVRYADTSGFETDHFFVTAWRYRDWVIESFNNDKPYTTFVQEQIAADELWSTNMELEGSSKLPKEKEENVKRRIGTSLFTIGSFPIEYTYYGDQFRAEWQADAVDTVGAAFLGLTLECARCHDHKFDPIGQRDYYKLAAMFAGSVEVEIPLVSLFDVQTNSRNFPLMAQAEALKQMARGGGRGRRPRQNAEETEDGAEAPRRQPPMDPDRAAMLQRLGEAYLRAPARYPTANVLGHEEVVPDTHILVRGEFKHKGEKVDPGYISALHPGPPINEPKDVLFVPRRRKALALWLTDPENPLLGRVMANRIWQGHFGEGIVRTPNDFGRQGEPPTHPELLDWLTCEFAARNWSIKQMHRLIMLSSAYRSSSVALPRALDQDPDNLYLSRMNRRRLDADALRDSMLAVAGTLNLKMGGVGIIPPLTGEELLAARMPNLWPAHPNPAEHNRRSIYLQMKRSLTLPMLQIFDAPDSAVSCARRETSTVAPQALALMNSEFSSAQAKSFAARVRKQAGRDDPPALVEAAWLIALGRAPAEAERSEMAAFLERNSLELLCLLLFNANEFVYVD